MALAFDGSQIVVYDRVLSSRHGLSGTIGILAHEIGHHICGHTKTRSRDPHREELQADRFIGAAWNNMGQSLEHAYAVLDVFSDSDSPSHPSRDKRRAAIVEGWEKPSAAVRCQ